MTRTIASALAVAVLAAAALTTAITPALAEILAMVNYESKTEESLKALKLTGPAERVEGILILDVDPGSQTFGQVLWNYALPPDLVAHHIFYDRSMTKAYVTSLGKSELHVLDMTSGESKRADLGEVPGVIPMMGYSDAPSFSPDSRTLAFAFTSATTTTDVYVWDL